MTKFIFFFFDIAIISTEYPLDVTIEVRVKTVKSESQIKPKIPTTT